MVGINPSKVHNATIHLDHAANSIDDIERSVSIAMDRAELHSHVTGLLGSLDFEFTTLASVLRPRANEAQAYKLELGGEFDDTYQTLRTHLNDPNRSRPEDKNNSIMLLANELARRSQDQEGQLSDETLEHMSWNHPDPRVRATAAMLMRYPSESELSSAHGSTSDRTLWHSVAQAHLERLTDDSLPFVPTNQSEDVNEVIGSIPLDSDHTPPVSLQYLWDNGHLDDAQLYHLAPPTVQQGQFTISTADFEPQAYWSEVDVRTYVDRWVEENPDGLANPQIEGDSKLDHWMDVLADQANPPTDVTWDDVLGFAVAAAQYGGEFLTGCIDLADPAYSISSEFTKDPKVIAGVTAAACVVGGIQYAGIPGVWDGTGEKILD